MLLKADFTRMPDADAQNAGKSFLSMIRLPETEDGERWMHLTCDASIKVEQVK